MEDLQQIAADVVALAMKGGATAADSVAREGSELSVTVRQGAVEQLKQAGSKAIGVRVMLGQRSASAYTSDLSNSGVQQLVSRALAAAKVTSEDPTARPWLPPGPFMRRPSASRSLVLQRSARPGTTPRPGPAGVFVFSII